MSAWLLETHQSEQQGDHMKWDTTDWLNWNLWKTLHLLQHQPLLPRLTWCVDCIVLVLMHPLLKSTTHKSDRQCHIDKPIAFWTPLLVQVQNESLPSLDIQEEVGQDAFDEPGAILCLPLVFDIQRPGSCNTVHQHLKGNWWAPAACTAVVPQWPYRHRLGRVLLHLQVLHHYQCLHHGGDVDSQLWGSLHGRSSSATSSSCCRWRSWSCKWTCPGHGELWRDPKTP